MTPPTPLADDLERLFTGGLSHCRGMLVTPDGDRRFGPAARLLDLDTLDEVLERFGRTHGGGADRRVVASLWSQWYVGTLVPPSVAAGSLLGRVLPLGIEEIEVLLDEETARPVAFQLAHEGTVDCAASPFDRFEGLVRNHLAPLVETLAPHVGLSPDTVWTNAGRYLQWILDEIERSEETREAESSARRLLNEESWPDGWRNPLHDTIRYVEEDGRRVVRRRVCCLQYLVPDLEGCGALCPLPHVREGTAGSD